MQQGLLRIVALLIVATALIGLATTLVVPAAMRRDVWIGLATALAAMLVGFMPLRSMLRHGPDRIVTAWIAAMALRMLAGVAGLVIVVKRHNADLTTTALTVCGGYFVLLMIETIAMTGLMRRAFEQDATKEKTEPR